MARQFHTGVRSSLSSSTGFEVSVIKRVRLWTWEGRLLCNPSFLLSLRFQMPLRMRRQRKSNCRTSSHSFGSAWTTRICSMVRVVGLCRATLPLCLLSVAQTPVRHALHPCSCSVCCQCYLTHPLRSCFSFPLQLQGSVIDPALCLPRLFVLPEGRHVLKNFFTDSFFSMH